MSPIHWSDIPIVTKQPPETSKPLPLPLFYDSSPSFTSLLTECQFHDPALKRPPCKDPSSSCPSPASHSSLAKFQPKWNPTTHLCWAYTLAAVISAGEKYSNIMTDQNVRISDQKCHQCQALLQASIAVAALLLLHTHFFSHISSIPINIQPQLTITLHTLVRKQMHLDINNLIFPPPDPPIHLHVDPHTLPSIPLQAKKPPTSYPFVSIQGILASLSPFSCNVYFSLSNY